MLKLNVKKKEFEDLSSTNLKKENIKERNDLQQAMIKSWDIIRTKLNIPNAWFIGDEVKAHEANKKRIFKKKISRL